MDKFPSKAEAAGLGMMVKTNVRHGHTHRDHACTHRHTDTHTYACTHGETHTHAHICTYAHPDTHAHAHNAHTGTHAHAHTRPHVHTRLGTAASAAFSAGAVRTSRPARGPWARVWLPLAYLVSAASVMVTAVPQESSSPPGRALLGQASLRPPLAAASPERAGTLPLLIGETALTFTPAHRARVPVPFRPGQGRSGTGPGRSQERRAPFVICDTHFKCLLAMDVFCFGRHLCPFSILPVL